MDLGIRGKVAMVAAGSKGLGRAAALALGAEGCAVSLCGRGAEALEATRKELEALGVRALAVAADVSSAADLARWHGATVAALGPVDILVTNTGGPKAATFDHLSDADWNSGVDSTLRAGLSGLTRTLALETAADGITVNALLPGHVMTYRQHHLAEVKSQAEGITVAEHFRRQAAAIPAKRIGQPEEVGTVIAFLCSSPASYLTGQSLLVDGGLVQGTF